MTKEELNIHIEKRYSECRKRSQGLSYGSFYDGYVDCYYEQQKRIAELQEEKKGQKEYMKYLKRQRQGGIQKQYNKVGKIKNLEKQIAELKAENELIKNSDTLCKLIGEQKLQIEKMNGYIKELFSYYDDNGIDISTMNKVRKYLETGVAE